ncbi:hypothetical protein F4780DRAFT_187853 [Xylariomycetidae sp. FL0641]|nr:hypothetical protein F4780DRAFT_187853 [Xylariomycetidae sp. FL0641]
MSSDQIRRNIPYFRLIIYTSISLPILVVQHLGIEITTKLKEPRTLVRPPELLVAWLANSILRHARTSLSRLNEVTISAGRLPEPSGYQAWPAWRYRLLGMWPTLLDPMLCPPESQSLSKMSLLPSIDSDLGGPLLRSYRSLPPDSSIKSISRAPVSSYQLTPIAFTARSKSIDSIDF